jgi:2-polyprenyl-3-methyl-5-hydroxy-6-metoxy-1,4-benzoquinol methylase
MTSKQNFSFGRNWERFLESLDEDRVNRAAQSLTEFLNVSDLQGRSLLDVGCGSGLFSYAAFKLGAKRIVSFDVDPFSVQCCLHLHSLASSPGNWKICEGSILDKAFVSSLGNFDVVYSWGGVAPYRQYGGIHREFRRIGGPKRILLYCSIQ